MTKRREPLTYHRALTTVAARIGWDSCAALCGVTVRAVRYWSDPDADREISILDAERLDRAFMDAGGDHPPFHRVHGLRLEIAARGEQDKDGVSIAARAAKETGEAVSALLLAGVSTATPALRRAAVREAEEAITALMDGVALLDRAKPKGTA